MLRVKFRVEKIQYDWDLLRLYYWPHQKRETLYGTGRIILDDEVAWRKEYIYRSQRPIRVNEFEFECSIPTCAIRNGSIIAEVKKSGVRGFFNRKRRICRVDLLKCVKKMGVEQYDQRTWMVMHITAIEQTWDIFPPIKNPEAEVGYFCEPPAQLHWKMPLTWQETVDSDFEVCWIIWSGNVAHGPDITEWRHMIKVATWNNLYSTEHAYCGGLGQVLQLPKPDVHDVIVAIPFCIMSTKPEGITELELHYCKTTMNVRLGPRSEYFHPQHGLYEQEVEHLGCAKVDIKEILEDWPENGYVVGSSKALYLRGRDEPKLITIPVIGMEMPLPYKNENGYQVQSRDIFSDWYGKEMNMNDDASGNDDIVWPASIRHLSSMLRDHGLSF